MLAIARWPSLRVGEEERVQVTPESVKRRVSNIKRNVVAYSDTVSGGGESW